MTEWKERLAKSLGIDLPGLLSLADKVFSDTEVDVRSSELVPAHIAGETLRDVARRIRELCGEADA